MRFGITLPTTGAGAGPAEIASVAEAAERVGAHSVWTFERLLAPTAKVMNSGYEMELPEAYRSVYSPLEVLAFVAARTTTISLGTSVLVAPLHNPVALARSVATVDQLSGGRAVLGLGQGWMQQEFDTAGVPMAGRGARFSELVEAMRAVWGPDPVSYSGEFYSVPESYVGPKPANPAGVPVLAGAVSPGGIARAARHGLGLNPIFFGWEALEGAVAAFRTASEEAGRDPAEQRVVLRVNGGFADAPDPDGPSPAGTVDQVTEAVPRLERLGVTEIFWDPPGERGPHLERLGRLIDAVA
ncbi:TIGR03619 family F420-dependent LLM class oxidoreductase [Pseudonocardia sp. TRM90224]|uniref:TIGR03619 family F420-dependent LLM class oxidoreductase n=1 Tax=Pseudonocardia sp. TRM90224 TaxID=2812678 RepID=UPI001E5AA63E|nr:TIGR03619 family F420-dependent LLM class oxidoreductase [Pseudonocardia sp. TRM90224]